MQVEVKVRDLSTYPKFKEGELYICPENGAIILCTSNTEPRDVTFDGVCIRRGSDWEGHINSYSTLWDTDQFVPFQGKIILTQ